jgi:hypothetical protein
MVSFDCLKVLNYFLLKIIEEMRESKIITEEDLESVQQKSYDCCICRMSSVPTAERPIGVVTLLQASNGMNEWFERFFLLEFVFGSSFGLSRFFKFS